MNRYLFGFLISSVLLSGCGGIATQPTPPAPPPATSKMIETWINHQEYRKAWLALSEMNSQHPDYDRFIELKTRLDRDIAAYEQQVIDQAAKSVRSNYLNKALKEYESGLAKLPDNARLAMGFERIQKQQRAQITKIRNRLLTLKGEYLVKALPEYEKIAVLESSDNISKHELDNAKKTADDLAQKISKLGSSELAEGQQEKGAYLLKLASRLTSDPVILSSYSVFQSTQSTKPFKDQTTNKKQVVKNNKTVVPERQAIKKSIAKFDKLFQQGELYKAKIFLDKLPLYLTHKDAISARRQQLKSAIKEQVSKLYQQGVDHYSKENYEIALNHWISVLRLQPDHEKAKEYTERTKRILDKLEQLREKQQSAPNPATPPASQ